MTKTLDARGLACPAPVLLVKDAVEKENLLELTVMVDNEASKENVSRFLSTKNYSVTKSSQGSDFLWSPTVKRVAKLHRNRLPIQAPNPRQK